MIPPGQPPEGGSRPDHRHEVLVVGGGPAGLSAALVFGRSAVDTVVVSAGSPRAAASAASHGFLTRDGTAALDLVALGREELARYPSVSFLEDTVVELRPSGEGFLARTEHGVELSAARVVLASGRGDDLERLGLPDLERVYGVSVYPCPFCDGWEHSGEPLAIFVSPGSPALAFAQTVSRWSEDAIVFTNASGALDEDAQRLLEAGGVTVETGEIAALAHDDGHLRAVELAEGRSVPRDCGFVATAGVETVTPLLAAIDEDDDRVQVVGDVGLGFAGIAEGVGTGYRVAKAVVKQIVAERWA